jgi:hypothetical protein|tara:strand:- start:2820 stop:3101 length:282 start_codon:yes stop_codon:yes gene_type:complete
MKNDWVSIITIGMMVSSVCASLIIYYELMNKDCISNPLVFAAQKYEKDYGYYVYGSMSLMTSGNIIAPTIHFNSKQISVQSFDGLPINITNIE